MLQEQPRGTDYTLFLRHFISFLSSLFFFFFFGVWINFSSFSCRRSEALRFHRFSGQSRSHLAVAHRRHPAAAAATKHRFLFRFSNHHTTIKEQSSFQAVVSSSEFHFPSLFPLEKHDRVWYTDTHGPCRGFPKLCRVSLRLQKVKSQRRTLTNVSAWMRQVKRFPRLNWLHQLSTSLPGLRLNLECAEFHPCSGFQGGFDLPCGARGGIKDWWGLSESVYCSRAPCMCYEWEDCVCCFAS